MNEYSYSMPIDAKLIDQNTRGFPDHDESMTEFSTVTSSDGDSSCERSFQSVLSTFGSVDDLTKLFNNFIERITTYGIRHNSAIGARSTRPAGFWRGKVADRARGEISRLNEDPLALSQTALFFTVVFLVFGEATLATCTCVVAFGAMREATRLSSNETLVYWYIASFVSMLVSVMAALAPMISDISTGTRNQWIWRVLPRLWGSLLGYSLYKTVYIPRRKTTCETGKDGVQSWEISLNVLQARNVGSEATPLYSLEDTLIEIKHGSVLLGTKATCSLLNSSQEQGNPGTPSDGFKTITYCHFLDIHKRIDCRVISSFGSVLGMARVPVPTLPNVKIASWYPIELPSRDAGSGDRKRRHDDELYIEVQTHPSAEQFLFRNSTLWPVVLCALAMLLRNWL